jgi:hypothetical protein
MKSAMLNYRPCLKPWSIRNQISHTTSPGASALNVALFWYLKWVEKNAFESRNHKPPPRSMKTKSEAWDKRRKQEERDARFGDRAPRVKIPSAVHDIWAYTILADLHNAELEQAQS